MIIHGTSMHTSRQIAEYVHLTAKLSMIIIKLEPWQLH